MVLVSMCYMVPGLCLLATVQGALVQVTDFGSNPTGLEMYIDLPENITTNAPVILAVSPYYGWSFQAPPANHGILLSFMDVAARHRDTTGRTILQPLASPEVQS